VPLVRLACFHCGGDLPSPRDAVLFACPICGRASALADGRLAPASTASVPIRLPTSAGATGHFPGWIFQVTWAEPLDGVPSSGGASPWRRPDRIVVPSLAPETGGAYLRLARALSLSADSWSPVNIPLRGAAGGQIGEAEAALLLVTVALACVPSALRRRLLEADTPPLSAGPATLVWLPFAHAGKRLLDLVAGIEVTDRLLGATPPAMSETPAPHLTPTRPPAHDAGDRCAGTDATAPVSRTQTGAAAASRELEPAGPGRAR
jgi:hypothetical protein